MSEPLMPLYPVTQLDANQVLQHSYDEPNQRLRVAAEITFTAPSDLEVSILNTEDSVAIGTSTQLFTATTSGGQVALDVALLPSQSPIAATPIVVNVSAPTASIEYSYTFTANTKKIMIQSRLNSKVQFSYTLSQSGTNFITIPNGAGFAVDELNLNGVTIYFQTDKALNTLEILAWT